MSHAKRTLCLAKKSCGKLRDEYHLLRMVLVAEVITVSTVRSAGHDACRSCPPSRPPGPPSCRAQRKRLMHPAHRL